MWCPKCQIEKQIEQTEATTSPVCDVCQSVLTQKTVADKKQASRKTSTQAKTSHAHELLQRWSDQRMLSPSGEMPKANSLPPLEEQNLPEISDTDLKKRKTDIPPPKQSLPPETKTVQQPKPVSGKQNTVLLSEHLKAKQAKPAPASGPTKRKTISISEQSVQEKPAASRTESTTTKTTRTRITQSTSHTGKPQTPKTTTSSNRTLPPRVKSRGPRPQRRPEYDVQAAIREQIMKQKSWLSAIGYLLSCGGALLLAGGAGLTLYSFFGKSVDNIPTEWLITTIGQLFLFAGMVMLISVVVDQVGKRILFRVSQLDDRLANIEEHLSRLETEETETTTTTQRQSVPLRKAS